VNRECAGVQHGGIPGKKESPGEGISRVKKTIVDFSRSIHTIVNVS
jgi:hypothetical protein